MTTRWPGVFLAVVIVGCGGPGVPAVVPPPAVLSNTAPTSPEVSAPQDDDSLCAALTLALDELGNGLRRLAPPGADPTQASDIESLVQVRDASVTVQIGGIPDLTVTYEEGMPFGAVAAEVADCEVMTTDDWSSENGDEDITYRRDVEGDTDVVWVWVMGGDIAVTVFRS